ncbi:MAG: hypothetical protein K0R19_87 [Bacillota bacterium]|jgi:alpha-beta hydrolase superfamily lysophospholipase|nr:hypothetical protein [Bacillota bacterium]
MYSRFELHNNQVELAGHEWRPEDPKAAVCMIHGIGEHAARYDRVGKCFMEYRLGLMGIDLRGHGLSAGKRGHTAPRTEILQDVDLLIDYARENYPGLPIILYGHSMGGNIALDYRRRGKHRSLIKACVITSPWLVLQRKIPWYLYQFSRTMAVFMPDFTMNAKIKSEDLGNSGILSVQENKHLMHGKITVRTALDGFDTADALLKQQLPSDDSTVPKPFLLMQGDADKICDPEGSRRLARVEGENCTYLEWPGLFHEIHNGGAESDGSEVISTMAEWVLKVIRN